MTDELVVTESSVEVPVEMTAGEMLRNARTTGRRKREIPTIAKQLCIREEFLEALENGDYNAIPETVYVLGFARNYAMELGLDPDEIVAKIKAQYPDFPIIATGGQTGETISATIRAGANVITWTPPSNAEVFRNIMAAYRQGLPHP